MEQIENIEIRFSGSANFREVYAEAAKLNAQLHAMQAEIAKIDDRKIRDLRTAFNKRLAEGQGSLATEAVKAKSATQLFTEALVKQDVTLAKSKDHMKLFNEVLREQYQLQRMTAVQWSKSAGGRITADVVVPTGVDDNVRRLTDSFKENTKELVKSRIEMASHAKGTDAATAASQRFTVAQTIMRQRLALGNEILSSYAANMVKWGKNTQWAGRQLMVGFTVPFAAFAAVAGIAANNVDKEMTRILKVYDYSAAAIKDSAVREAEANELRRMSFESARKAAREWGVEMQDTLEIQAELAATGMTGADLVNRTSVLNKAMIMGELDKQQAIKASTALQTAYGHSTKEINQDFEFMATIANATSLSMSDFVEGLPRGAAILENVGVGLKDMGVLMAALKQAGVPAGEGMNGLRSGAQRLLQITPKAEKMWAQLLPKQESITAIVESFDGQFVPSLGAIGEAMRDLEPYQKQQVITNIFGIHQANRMFSVMDGLINKTNQVGKAIEVANNTAEENAEIAANSLATVTNSASNRIQRAIAGIKAELAGIGEVFLPMAAQIMEATGNLLKWFNGWGEGKKQLVLAGFALAAVAGVITMLVGLTGNFIGTIIGLGTWLSKVGLRTKTLTLEQQAQAMMAQRSSALWRDQGLAAQTLSYSLQKLVTSLDNVTLAQQRAMLAGGTISAYAGRNPNIPAGTPVITHNGPNGRTTRPATADELAAQRRLDAAEGAARAEREGANASASSRRNWTGIATAATATAVAGTMIYSSLDKAQGASTSISEHLMNAVIIGSLIGPTMVKTLNNQRVKTALGSVKEAFGAGKSAAAGGRARGLVGGLRSALPVAGSLVKVMARFAGPVGLLVSAGLAWKSINDGMNDARQKQIALNNSAQDWAKILGFDYTEAAKGKAKNDQEAAVNLAKKFREANAEAAKGLDIAAKSKNAEDLVTAAINEGVKARMHGASAAQARLATQTALAVAGKNEAEIKEMMIAVDARIDFGNMDMVAKAEGERIGKLFTQAMNNELKSDKWITRMWENFKGGMTAASKQAAEEAGKAFWNAFSNAETPDAKKMIFENLSQSVSAGSAGIVSKINNSGPMQQFFREQNGGIAYDYQKYAEWLQNPNPGSGGMYNAPIDPEDLANLEKAVKAEKELIANIAKQRGLGEGVIKNLHTMNDLRRVLNVAEMTSVEATGAWQEELRLATNNGEKLNEGQKLAILNHWRGKAGMDAATDSAQGFGAAMAGASGAVDQFGESIDANIMTAEEWGDAWTNATKEAMEGAQNMALDEAERIRAEQQERILQGISDKYEALQDAADARAEKKNESFEKRAKALQDRHDRDDRALENRQQARAKAVEDSYDRRIQKIEKSIEAEEKAEEIRQRIFEAEKQRLERMAAMQNANIDFNVAVNTGNLDEAAKLFNNMQSQQDSWALEDATAGSAGASDARKAAQQKQIDAIDKAKDAALDSLRKREDAEKDALKAKQEREKDALDAEKDRYAKGVEAQKKKLQQSAENDRRAAEEELRRRKQTLELELLAIRASTPRNKAEYDAQIKAIQGAYARYGVDLTARGNAWAKSIGGYLTANVAASAKALANNINWKAYAAKITADFVGGAFNMDITEFGKWITTGKAPNDAFQKPKDMRVNASQKGAHGPGGSHSSINHGGGLLGTGGGSGRKGYSAGQGIMPSEISVLAQKGEYVMQKDAVRKYGVGIMDEINEGKFGDGMGGANLGLTGIIGAGLAGALRNMMQMGVASAAMRQMALQGAGSASIGKAGAYGNIKLNSDQLKNAASIMSTGKSLGASKRDLVIALMTAMQESTLRNINYGDRDSVGLFQQRPSQGWGTVEQIMNPTYSATKFFKELFKVKGRDQMPLTLAAQAVQRSAFPMAYAKWEGMAQALVNGTTFSGGGGMGLEQMLAAMAGGGIGKAGGFPMTKGSYRVSSEYGMRTNPVTGVYKLHNGIDLAAPGGTPIFATNSGKVLNAGWAGGYGNYTVIAHPDGTQTGYAHQSRINVKAGQTVSRGQHIGAVGTTGNSTGNHLHFQMGRGGNWANPRQFIPGLNKGGYTLNDGYAMLHKSETVLTADLSDKLKSGINNLANGAGNRYDVTVDLRGAYIRDEMDIKGAVKGAFKELMYEEQSKKGFKRKVTG